MSQAKSPKLHRPTRRSWGYGTEGRPESPLARPSSPHLSTHAGTSAKQAWLSPASEPSTPRSHVHSARNHPNSPKPVRKISASSSIPSKLNRTYPFGRHSDIEYSSGESDGRSGYDSNDGAASANSTATSRRERSPRYYPMYDNDYSSGGNPSPAIFYHDDEYPYDGSLSRSGYAYDRSNVYQWNSTPFFQSGASSFHYSTPAYAYSDDFERAAELAREAKKAQQLQAYVAWVNSQLKKRPGCRIVEDLRRDMQDGVPLVHLVEIVSGETLARVDYNPQTTTAMRDNVERVLQFMASKRIRMHHTSAKDIVDGNLKAIMRLILALAAHYKPSSVKQTPQVASSSAVPTTTPTGRKAQRQASFVAMAANAAAAIHDVRKEAAGAGSSLRRYREQRGIGLRSRNSTSPATKEQIQQRLRASSSSDSERPASRTSPLPSMVASSPSPTPSNVTRSSDRSITSSPRLHVGSVPAMSDSDQGSPEEGRSRSSSRRSSIAWSEALLEEHNEMTTDLETTKKMLNQLQELLLSGRLQDDDGSSEAEEDQMMFEGSNAKEQVVVLQARLRQSQEECGQLKTELSKTKQECRNLQGTKTDLKRRLEEKERMTSDLTRQLNQKDDLLKQQQEQIESLTQQLQELNSFKTELQNQLENKTNSGDYQLQTQLQELTQRLDNVNMAEANLAAHITSQDRQLMKLEDRMHSSTLLPFKEGSEELQTMRSALRSLRSNMSSHDPNHHPLDTLEQGICTLMDHLSVSKQRGMYKDSDTSSTESLSKRYSTDSNSQELNHRSSHQHSNYGKPRASSVSSSGSNPSACTKVLYFTERTVTPFMNSIPKRLGEVTLRDFKQIFDREGNFRYHFKALDPEFGTIKEEVVDDDAILPGWEGKIVGWVEQDNG
ncbi:dixin-like isoform X3 [Acanthaster planci]|uniref:Dixin n=1 Tax=Acanthaster planci TaxID=133434 RepID=A0A8B7Z0V4_ACAPL|nr:dixin-like isoform X3 [Acanthaster planci]